MMNDTRTKILDVADDLVQRVGLNAMSYKHISDAVGIRKASIHHHFPKKEDLVDELLKRCEISYGYRYCQIADGKGEAPEKLRKLTAVFAEGLSNKKLCLVGSICTNSNTLHDTSSHILQDTIKNTMSIFSRVFGQGRVEQTLNFEGSDEEAGFAFFSFLVGAQTISRTFGGTEKFLKATEVVISNFEK
jgi:TetR/AcrR family transcriptional regulator, transcriptional repressor for nem operon